MPEWFDDEVFWEQMFPHMFSEERLSMAAEEVNKILSLVEFQKETALDLCCGPGRHAVALAKQGFQVTGVDKTPFLLEKARQKASDEKVDVEWILEDMRRFLRPNTYSLVLNMLTSLGYFDDKQDDMLVLQNMYQCLRPEGVCVLDMMGKEILANNFHPTISEQQPDGSILIQRREIFDDWSRLRNERVLTRDGKAFAFTFHQTIYSGQELKDRLLQVGFKNVKLFGNLNGEEYGPNASRLIAIAWKKGE